MQPPLAIVFDEDLAPGTVYLKSAEDAVVVLRLGYGTSAECVELVLATRAVLNPGTTCEESLAGLEAYRERVAAAIAASDPMGGK